MLIAFPRQKWCRERAYISRYKYIACIVDINLSYYVCTYSEIKIPFSILLLGLKKNILNNFMYSLNLFNITYFVY